MKFCLDCTASCTILDPLEHILLCPTFGADPAVGQVLKGSAGRYIGTWVAHRRVVHVATDHTFPFFHLISCLPHDCVRVRQLYTANASLARSHLCVKILVKVVEKDFCWGRFWGLWCRNNPGQTWPRWQGHSPWTSETCPYSLLVPRSRESSHANPIRPASVMAGWALAHSTARRALRNCSTCRVVSIGGVAD